jgi:hypothetical protein
MPHGECYETKVQGPPCLSATPKAGVKQYNYVTGPDFAAHALQGLDEMAGYFNQGILSAHVDRVFPLADAALAFNYSAGPGAGGGRRRRPHWQNRDQHSGLPDVQ